MSAKVISLAPFNNDCGSVYLICSSATEIPIGHWVCGVPLVFRLRPVRGFRIGHRVKLGRHHKTLRHTMQGPREVCVKTTIIAA